MLCCCVVCVYFLGLLPTIYIMDHTHTHPAGQELYTSCVRTSPQWTRPRRRIQQVSDDHHTQTCHTLTAWYWHQDTCSSCNGPQRSRQHGVSSTATLTHHTGAGNVSSHHFNPAPTLPLTHRAFVPFLNLGGKSGVGKDKQTNMQVHETRKVVM